MANKLYEENDIADIADAIREKNGTTDTYTVSQMGDAVRAIPTGSDPVLIDKAITANGTYSASDDDADGYSSVSVNVQGGAVLEFVPASSNQACPQGTYSGIDEIFYNAATMTIGAQTSTAIKGVKKNKVAINSKSRWDNNFNNSDFEEIDVSMSENAMRNATHLPYLFQNCKKLITITGNLDFSSSILLANVFSQCVELKNVRFAANSVPLSISLQHSPNLTDESIVSAANGLSAEATSQTLTLSRKNSSSPYYKCSTIMGNVVDGLFVADESGTTSLATFITNVKGWTLAGGT